MGKSVFLVGLMGAGKTTVGRLLAKELKYQFVDSDHEIERRNGVAIPTIFEIEGESGFRLREKQVIAELSRCEQIVLATGGGAILDPENRRCLHESGMVVYLAASPDTLHERTRHDRGRPLLQVDDRLSTLRDLYQLRDPLYREAAHMVVEVGHAQAQHVARHIAKRLSENA